MKILLALCLAVALTGCATYSKGLDVVDGALTAAKGAVGIFRAAGEDSAALWGNVWSPVGLADSVLAKPFDAPVPAEPAK